MSPTNLEQLAANSFSLQGDLLFSTAKKIFETELEEFKEKLSNSNETLFELSLKKVEQFDSSAIALLIEFFRIAQLYEKQLNICDMPEQMQTLAKLSSINELLTIKER